MPSTLRSLVRKEWRELRWESAGIAVVLVAVPAAVSLGAGGGFLGMLSITTMYVIPIAVLFFAARISAGERSR
ncbi:MAG: hypothetical protein AAF961_06415, partial [Planctomycetota bacterium]